MARAAIDGVAPLAEAALTSGSKEGLGMPGCRSKATFVQDHPSREPLRETEPATIVIARWENEFDDRKAQRVLDRVLSDEHEIEEEQLKAAKSVVSF